MTLIREFRAEFLAISASLGLEKERENLRWRLLGRENDKYRHPETPEPCGAYILSLPLGSLPVSKSNCDDLNMSMVIGVKQIRIHKIADPDLGVQKMRIL